MNGNTHRASPALRRPAVFGSMRALVRIAPGFLLAALLAGCGTTPVRQPGPGEVSAPSASSAQQPPVSQGGGYYLNDGPGANPPPNLASIPNAVPRILPLDRAAMRPYTVMGYTYAPMTALAPYHARGIASWYGRRYNGKLTASGERYNMYAMTAAHPTLPIPSFARVTNLANGKSVIVRINDRGPFLNHRLIDLSYTAAYKLGIIAGGSAMVEVDSLIPGVNYDVAKASAPRPVVATPDPPPAAAPAQAQAEPTIGAPPAGIFLQLGAFGSRDNAESYLAQLRVQVQWLADRLKTFQRGRYYRVWAGPYDSRAQANSAAERLAQALGTRPFIVDR